VHRRVAGLSRLVLVERAGGCPVIAFADPAVPEEAAEEHRFRASEFIALLGES
jgi:hypothetical protein